MRIIINNFLEVREKMKKNKTMLRRLGMGGGWLWALVLTGCASVAPVPVVNTEAPPHQTVVTPPVTVVQPVPVRRPVHLGLALGGGAARGFAHVGVIQVLEGAGLKPSHVVGTSAGSLVAALYASGKSPQDLRRVADTME